MKRMAKKIMMNMKRTRIAIVAVMMRKKMKKMKLINKNKTMNKR